MAIQNGLYFALCFCIVRGSEPIDLGPIDVEAEIGSLINKYETLSPQDKEASANARHFIEKFRWFFETGLGGIPPLDPYTNFRPSPAYITNEDVQGTINFSDVELKGTKGFRLIELDVRIETGRVDFKVAFPHLTKHVNYEANFKVDEAHSYFSGHANTTLHEVLVTGAISVVGKPPGAATHDQTLVVEGLQYRLTAINAQYNLRDRWSLLKSGNRKRRSLPSSKLTKTVAQEIAGGIAKSIAVTVASELNKMLASHYTVAQIMALLIPRKLDAKKT